MWWMDVSWQPVSLKEQASLTSRTITSNNSCLFKYPILLAGRRERRTFSIADRCSPVAQWHSALRNGSLVYVPNREARHKLFSEHPVGGSVHSHTDYRLQNAIGTSYTWIKKIRAISPFGIFSFVHLPRKYTPLHSNPITHIFTFHPQSDCCGNNSVLSVNFWVQFDGLTRYIHYKLSIHFYTAL